MVGGGTLTLSGVNTYSGPTTISNGTLALSNAGSISNSNSIAIATGATFDISNVKSALSASGIPPGLTGTTINSLQDGSSGTISLGANTLFISNQTANATFSGTVTGTAQTFSGNCSSDCLPTQGVSLGVSGGGTLTLTGVNAYTGYTGVFGATLALAGSGDISTSGGVVLRDGSAFDISGLSAAGTTVAGLQDGGNSGGGTISLGSKTLTVGTAFGPNANQNSKFSGVISGTGGLTAAGTGTLTLSNTNTYTGATTINSGTLALQTQCGNCDSNPPPAIPTIVSTGDISKSSGVTINSGAVFDISQLSTVSGGNFAPTTAAMVAAIQDGTGGGGNIYLGSNTLTIGIPGSAANANQDLQFSGVISDCGGGNSCGAAANCSGNCTYSGSLFKDGTGTLTLSGDNTYSHGTTINAGKLQLGNGGTSGSIVGDVTDNGTFAIKRSDTYTFGGVISGSGGFQQNGGGTTVLTATNTYSGGTAINAGTLAVGADANLGAATGGLTFDGGTLQFGSSFNLAATRNITLSAGGGTLDANGNSTTISQGIGGGGGLKVIDSSSTGGGTVTLSGNNTYSGATDVGNGNKAVTLALSGAGSISQSSQVAIATGGTFDISQTNAGASITTLADTAVGQAGNVALGSQTLTITNGSKTFSGIIADSGSGGSLAITGGTQTLAGNNTYTGGTSVTGGATAAVTLGSDGSKNSSVGSGTVTLNNGTFQNATKGVLGATASLTFANNFNLGAGGGTLDTTGGNLAFNGAISDAVPGTPGALTIAGGGTVTLTNSNGNTYSGATTINSGSTLATGAAYSLSANSGVTANGTLDLGSLNQTIASLSGSGTVTSLTNPQSVPSGNTAVLTIVGGASQFDGAIRDGQSATPAAGVLTGLAVTNGSALTLTGNNTYSGGTSVTGGSAVAIGASGGVASSLGTGNVSLIDGTLQNASGKALSFGASQQFNIGSTGGSGAMIDLNGASGGNMTINGVIADAGGTVNGQAVKAAPLIVMGGNTLTLTNANNTYSGGTGVLGSTVAVGAQGAAGSGFVVLIDGTLKNAASGNLAFTNTQNFYLGSIGGSGATIDLSGGNVTIAGQVADANPTIATKINGHTITPGELTVTGNNTLTLTNTGNTYSGSTTISAGSTLAAGAANAFSANSAVTNDGKLDLGTNSQTISAFNGSGVVGNFSGSGAGPAILTVSNGGTFDGTITDGSVNGVTTGLTVAGGTLTLRGSNSYSGATTIEAGSTLAAGAANALSANSAVTVNGTLDLGLSDQTVASLNGSSSGLVGSPNGGFGVVKLTVSNGGTFAGTIENGNLGGVTSLSLTGGTLTLSGNNTYTGVTTITGATLALSGTGSIKSFVLNNGTFDISGLTNGGVAIAGISGSSSGIVKLGGNTLTSRANGDFAGVIEGTGGTHDRHRFGASGAGALWCQHLYGRHDNQFRDVGIERNRLDLLI